ncbi:MAG: ATP synthase F1 subunit epsilon [Rhodospirillales bacterium]
MTEKIPFELVTPERVVLAEEADMVVVPGGDGDFGVLPGHAPLLSTVRPGTLEVHEGDRVTMRIFVSGGFAEVADGRCTVLADEAVHASEIDRADAEERLKRARDAHRDAAPEGPDHRRADTELRAAEAMVAAAK